MQVEEAVIKQRDAAVSIVRFSDCSWTCVYVCVCVCARARVHAYMCMCVYVHLHMKHSKLIYSRIVVTVLFVTAILEVLGQSGA